MALDEENNSLQQLHMEYNHFKKCNLNNMVYKYQKFYFINNGNSMDKKQLQ